MECPKCGFEIDDKATVCPHCKKVLKLVCPICRTVNDNNVCKKCGYVIITKCNKCGKVNPTEFKKCKKCGSDLEKSVILNESNTDDFVMMTINFPNVEEMKTLLGSVKLLNKFKINLDKIIHDYTRSVGLRRQIIKNTYVIRCNRDYTFKSSVETAMKVSIELINRITKMNCKLTKKKNASIRCNVFLMKRTVEDNPNDYSSGFNISLLTQNIKKKEDKILNTFQILADQSVSDIAEKEYKVLPLNSVMVNDEMVMFYEIDVKDLVTVEYPEEEDDGEVKIPNFVQNMLIEQDKLDGTALNNLDYPEDPDRIYDIKPINFEEINCEFLRLENINVFDQVLRRIKEVPHGILALKTAEMYKPYSLKLINTIESLNVYNNIITITCYDEMKYSPYSFFRDLVSAIFEYTVSQKLFFKNDFSMFSSVDPEGMVRDLITLHQRDVENTEDTRYTYFDIFLTLLQAIPNTLIFIDNFDKIDSSSYDVLKFLFEAFDKLEISYLISYDKIFALHKQSHSLLSKPYYAEFNLKPTAFEKMIEENKYYYRNILDNFYFQRIAKYSCGSILFIDIAIQYLIESGVYEAKEDSIEMINPKTIIIPSNLNRLMKRRINLLKDDVPALKFLTSVVLLGTRIDIDTIESLGYENVNDIIDKLTHMGYIYFYNNCMYFPNYNLLRDSLLDVVSIVYLKEIAAELFDKVLDYEMPSPVKAYLYNLTGDNNAERQEWEHLAAVNLSMGDFSSYLNCTNKILQILDKNKDEEQQQEIEEYKLQLYESISNNLYEYVPDKTSEIAEITLQNLEKTTDVDKIVMLCNKMINGNLSTGNYTQALELTHKVLSIIPPASLDPDAPDYNAYFFMMSLIHIQILFNIGALSDALDVGFRVLNVVSESTLEKLRPEYIDMDSFRALIIDAVGYVSLANVILLGGNVQEFLKIVRQDLNGLPQSYDLFIGLQDMIHGAPLSVTVDGISENDRFGGILYHLMSAYWNFDGDYTKFAEEIYKSKITARQNNLHQLELFADLMIGYSYMQMGSYEKADSIFQKIIKTANDKGMSSLLYTAWFMMSELKLKQHKYDVAYGIVNNSLIQLEKNNMSTEYLIMLFKYNMFKVLMYQKEFDKAEICINHAKYIAAKYGINFMFNENPDNYVPIDDSENEEIQEYSEIEETVAEESEEL